MDTLLQNIGRGLTMVKMKRLIGLSIIFAVCTFINMIIKYVFTLFVVFCVVYTMQDLYKHRKKFVWCLRMVINAIIVLTQFSMGDEYAQYVQTWFVSSKVKKPRNKR
jgi:hypothetical protein